MEDSLSFILLETPTLFLMKRRITKHAYVLHTIHESLDYIVEGGGVKVNLT